MGKHKINEEPLNGKCSICGGIYSKAAMRKHLESCTRTKKSLGSDSTRKRNTFHIVVEGVHHPEYWMRLEANADATLEDLDSFLRDTWLECCGHMSAFTIQKTRYIAGSGIDSMWVERYENRFEQSARCETEILSRVRFWHYYGPRVESRVRA